MTDPVRWSDAGDFASEIEQLLVQSAQSRQMPSSDRQAVWNRIAEALPASCAPTPEIGSVPRRMEAAPVTGERGSAVSRPTAGAAQTLAAL